MLGSHDGMDAVDDQQVSDAHALWLFAITVYVLGCGLQEQDKKLSCRDISLQLQESSMGESRTSVLGLA